MNTTQPTRREREDLVTKCVLIVRDAVAQTQPGRIADEYAVRTRDDFARLFAALEANAPGEQGEPVACCGQREPDITVHADGSATCDQCGMALASPTDPGAERERTLAKIAKAREMVIALASGQREWMFSIPARPEHDPDLIIMSALDAAARALTPTTPRETNDE